MRFVKVILVFFSSVIFAQESIEIKHLSTAINSIGAELNFFQDEKNQVTDPTIKNHLDERIDAVERDRKRIREMFPDITKEEWDVNTN